MSGRKRWTIGLVAAVLMAFASAAPAGAADPQERSAKRALERAEQALRGELGKRDVTLALRALALNRSHLRGAGALIDRLSWRGLKTLRGAGPRYGFTAPSAGRLTLTLKRGKRTLATHTRRVTRAGVVRGRLRATKAARRGVLRRARSVRAVLTVRFTPAGGRRVQVTRRVTLTR